VSGAVYYETTSISGTETVQSLQLEDEAIIECSYSGRVRSVGAINIVVKSKSETQKFKVKETHEMKKIFKAYADIHNTGDMSSLRFFFNDKLISETDTCQSLQLKEGDQIDCYTRSEILVLELLRQIQLGISFSALLEKIVDLPRYVIRESTFVHRAIAIMSKKTPLEFMEHIINAFPDEVSRSSGLFCPHGRTQSYLLHLACYNEHCPTSIINLLIEKYPDALGHFCVVERGVKVHGHEYAQWKGLPLHYYLSREKNIDIDTVKMLVEAYPQAMLTSSDDSMQSTPIHVVVSNSNIKNKCEIITSLLDSEPSSVRYIDAWGRTLLARICSMSGVDSLFEVIQIILNAWPEALMIGDERGCLPLHCLCSNSGLEHSSLDLLNLLINDDTALLRIVDNRGFLPLHYAVFNKSTDFCEELIALCPETVWSETSEGEMPIHIAANSGRVDTVRYLLEVCPESVHVTNNYGYLPIHKVAMTQSQAPSAEATPEQYTLLLELLLEFDPSAASVAETDNQSLPLHLACAAYSEYLPIVQLLFDQYPAAIWAKDEDGNTPLDLVRWRENKNDKSDTAVIDFLEEQLKYVTEDMILDGNESTTRSVFWSNLYKCTQDGSGSLPLHHSLRNNASLGVIKVLLYGNSGTLRVTNHQGFLPIHIACQYSSVKVVKFLVEEHENGNLSLNNNGPDMNSLLHYACRSGDCEKVNYLLDKQAAFVSTCNSDQKLPIHLLCESGVDDESVAYVETIWRMLLANPEL